MTALKISTFLLFSSYPFALNTFALRLCLYPSLITAPKGFPRAGEYLWFHLLPSPWWKRMLASWFLLIVEFTSLTQKSSFTKKKISSASYFFWANTERIFSKKQYPLSFALLSFTFLPLVSFSTLITGCITKIESSLCFPCTSQLF